VAGTLLFCALCAALVLLLLLRRRQRSKQGGEGQAYARKDTGSGSDWQQRWRQRRQGPPMMRRAPSS